MRSTVLFLFIAMTTCLVQAPAAAAATTHDFSYETGVEGWVPKTDQNVGIPECGKHDSSVVHSADRARDGVHSVDLRAHGRADCGLLWIEREFVVGTAGPVTVDVSFWVWSDDRGDVGTGGVNRVQAMVGQDCVKDPRRSRFGGWEGFSNLGSTGHKDGPGWFRYGLNAKVMPNSAGRICVAQGLMIASTYGFIKHYYVDQTRVMIT